MPSCSVFGCTNHNSKNAKLPPSERVKFHSFPAREPFRSKWVHFCGRKDPINVKNATICSTHFTQADQRDILRNRLLGYSPERQRKLKPDAVPSQNGPKSRELTPLKRKMIEERSQRSTKRSYHRLALSLLGTAAPDSTVSIIEPGPSEPQLIIDDLLTDIDDAEVVCQPFDGSSSADKITCSAPNCSNRQDGYALFMFPSERPRKTAWIEKCNLGQHSTDSPLYLCEVHFENDQFRKHRKTKQLKNDAIPTIFNMDSQTGISKEQSPDHPTTADPYFTAPQYSPINLIETYTAEGSSPASPARSAASPVHGIEERSTSDLLEEIARLKHQMKKMEQMLRAFLTDEQIQGLGHVQQERDEEKFTWSPESIARGLKFQFNLGVHGYNFLRSTNYPLPDTETLNAMLGDSVISFGVFEDLSELLQYKVQALDPLDRLCTISLDEMKISDVQELDGNKGHLISGDVKAHGTETGGSCITVVLVRGLRSSWEQVIACDTTSAPEGMSQRTLLEKSISFAEECGLRVLSFSSNLTANSRLTWSAYGVDVTKCETERVTHFSFNNHEIHIVPDVCHLLMALKEAVSTEIHLSQSLVDSETLPSIRVSSEYVKELWNFEIETQPAARLLHHLQERDVKPDANDRISLESAVQFFSVETARALESAVMSKTINPDALSTAYFCRLIDRWFSICDSKAPEDGITVDNRQTVFDFLGRFIEVCQCIKIDDGWSPVNAGMIMSTVSLCEVVNILLQQEGFGVVLLHRFSQDVVEDVVSQMSRVSDSTPTVFSVQCLNVLKTITISQLVSDLDRSCYSIPSINMNNWIGNCVKTPSSSQLSANLGS